MKKIAPLFFLLLTLVSCNSDDETVTQTSIPLQKVIFNYNNPNYEKHWNFNENGLLSEITKADGTVLQTFSYNNTGQLVSSVIYNSTSPNQTYTFTYDATGNVSSYNGTTISYDNATDSYYTGDLSGSNRVFKINAEGLPTYGQTETIVMEEAPISYYSGLFYANYSNNNLTGVNLNNITLNSYVFDTAINPLRSATLAAFKAFGATHTNTGWLNPFAVSANNVIRKNYPQEYYIHEEFEYTFNENNLPVSATLKFYSNNVLDFSYETTKYYYQGDTIP